MIELQRLSDVVTKLDARYGFYLLENSFSLPKLLCFLHTSPCFEELDLLQQYIPLFANHCPKSVKWILMKAAIPRRFSQSPKGHRHWIGFPDCSSFSNRRQMCCRVSSSEVNRSATAHLVVPQHGCENLRKTLAVVVNLSKRTDIMVFHVPEARDVSRGTTTLLLSWNRCWVPSNNPQFWNQMVWPEQTESAQME